jgi:hypothetical protein
LLKVQNEFAAAMSRDDPRSEDRIAHFAWLDKNEYVRRYGVQRIGWHGGILRCESRPGGGWLITVSITPSLVSSGGIRCAAVFDKVEETYEFVGDQVHLVKTKAAVARPDRQVFPVAL